ncbi:hypothetical protein [Mycobacterium sp. URHB0021]
MTRNTGFGVRRLITTHEANTALSTLSGSPIPSPTLTAAPPSNPNLTARDDRGGDMPLLATLKWRKGIAGF